MNRSDEMKLKGALTTNLKYQSPEITKKHIARVLDHYRGLAWKIESFVFNDGTLRELVNLQGTIPITYKGETYHIPIKIWLLDTHPNNAPMCYVAPTPEMSIKISQYVDHNGKIYLPYLHEWLPQKSDLGSLIQIMILIFSEHPPVIRSEQPYPPVSPYPKQVMPQMPMPGGGYPPAGTIMPGSYPQTMNSLPYPTSYPYHQTPSIPMPTVTDYSTYPTPYPPYNSGASVLPSTGGNGSSGGTITEEHIRASLLSAIGDKLRRRLQEQFSQLQAELETLRRTQQELTSGSNRLTELFSKLQKEKVELERNIKILQDKESELEKDVTKLSDSQSIDVDEAVTTMAPLHKQMLNAFVEEAAIEDAIYYLAEGLRSSIIDLDAFLKQVRQLSRKQFMLRALMTLCRQKAGLVSYK